MTAAAKPTAAATGEPAMLITGPVHSAPARTALSPSAGTR